MPVIRRTGWGLKTELLGGLCDPVGEYFEIAPESIKEVEVRGHSE